MKTSLIFGIAAASGALAATLTTTPSTTSSAPVCTPSPILDLALKIAAPLVSPFCSSWLKASVTTKTTIPTYIPCEQSKVSSVCSCFLKPTSTSATLATCNSVPSSCMPTITITALATTTRISTITTTSISVSSFEVDVTLPAVTVTLPAQTVTASTTITAISSLSVTLPPVTITESTTTTETSTSSTTTTETSSTTLMETSISVTTTTETSSYEIDVPTTTTETVVATVTAAIAPLYRIRVDIAAQGRTKAQTYYLQDAVTTYDGVKPHFLQMGADIYSGTFFQFSADGRLVLPAYGLYSEQSTTAGYNIIYFQTDPISQGYAFTYFTLNSDMSVTVSNPSLGKAIQQACSGSITYLAVYAVDQKCPAYTLQAIPV